jgi:hypothetical protein
MRVTFHAYPGMQLLGPNEKPDILTGDGVYEETWAAPHEWRREVTFSGYHAIEVESEKGRKIQVSSDYEPSRVLMLLNALLEPIPRNYVSREFGKAGIRGWKIDHVSVGKLQLVSVSNTSGSESGDVTDAFYFLPTGEFVMKNHEGLSTAWEGRHIFAGKSVPAHITVRAGERVLLEARVLIDGSDLQNQANFELPGPPADPGMTLRPLQIFEVRLPDSLRFSHSWGELGNKPSMAFSIWEVVDRHGRYKEVEMILAPSEQDAARVMNLMRMEKHPSPEIDGKPCELGLVWSFLSL